MRSQELATGLVPADRVGAAELQQRARAVFATRVETLYAHAPQVLLANVVNAAIVGAVLWGTAEPTTIVAWWSAMLAMVVVRVAMGYRFRRRPAWSSMGTWAHRFTLGSLVSGAIWGVGAVALYSDGHLASQVLLAFVVGGMGAGASSSVASHLPAFYAFLVPAVFPLALRFGMDGDRVHLGMAAMLVLFGLLVSVIGRTTHKTLVESYRLRFANEKLVERLRDAHDQLAQSHGRLEERVAERTQQLRDETKARADVQRQLQRALRLEAIGRLTGGVAHDFNNLLTVIVQSLELLESARADDRPEQLIATARDAALRGGELTRSLLAFSRRQDLRPEIVDPSEVVQGMVTSMLRRVLPQTIDLRVEGSSQQWLTRVDVTQLETALLNLVVNARDAMTDSGTLTLGVSTASRTSGDDELTDGDFVEICVVDDGVGIPTGVLDRVFEPFFTTKADHGSGLGLSMVYGFARQSGGSVRLESTPGRGTTARLLLPRYTGCERPGRAHERATGTGGHGELVLVVEDEDAVRELTVRSLQGLGYRTCEAKNATEALARLGQAPVVDLLITDVVMPGGLDGLELASIVETRFPTLPVLVVSGYAEPPSAPVRWPTLAKPYRREQLAAAVRKAVLRSPGPGPAR